MSYEKMIIQTKKIESILVQIGGTGKGLYEKVSSLKSELDENIVKTIKFILTVRNQAVHEYEF